MRDGGVRTGGVEGASGNALCVWGRCSCDTSVGLGLRVALCGPFTSQRRLTRLHCSDQVL